MAAHKLQDALDETAQDFGPGLFGLVSDRGQIVFSGSVGIADLENPRPITADDQFRIGSVTKTYVAALTLILADDNVLALADTVERWLPGVIPGGDRITLELLLRMWSGIPDYVPALFDDPPSLSIYDRYYSPEALVQSVFRGQFLEPRSQFRYSNTDYVILGLIIEKATGQRLEAQLWQHIFRPLRLRDTTFPEADPYLRGPHATGYVRLRNADPYVECTTITPSEAWASGAIVSTPGDVARFFEALFDGTLLNSAQLARMLTAWPRHDGHEYGMGIRRYRLADGTAVHGHHGGTPGYNTIALRSDAAKTVVLYANALDLEKPLPWNTPFVAQGLTA